MNQKTAFPLFWPAGRPRSKNRKTHTSFQTSFAGARDGCILEIRRLGGSDVIISTNIPLRRDGIPQGKGWNESIPDPGVAVYFKRNGKEMCFACDCWRHVQDNMHAICLTIGALRGIARWGTGDMMEAAFAGFRALPAPGETGGEKPWEVLGVAVNATMDQVKEAYRVLVKKFHTDNPHTGNAETFHRITAAYNLMSQNFPKTA